MLKLTFEFEYLIGDTVYLVTDPEQLPHLVIGYRIMEDSIRYLVSYMSHSEYYTTLELSKIRDESKAMGIDKKQDGTA